VVAIVSEQRQLAVGYEHGNEPSDFIKCGEFLYHLRKFWVLRKNSAPWKSLHS
jgi:hypothetical protein